MKTGRKRNIKLVLIILALLMIPTVQAFSLPVNIYGNAGGGAGFIESTINGFYLKSMPVISTGITAITKNRHRTRLGLDLGLSYSLKSNYNDYFYYGPFFEIGLSPFFELNIFKFLSLGFFGTLAPTFTGYENSMDLKLGGYFLIPIRTKWLKSILLQYEHGFIAGYKVNEKIILKTRILIYKKG